MKNKNNYMIASFIFIALLLAINATALPSETKNGITVTLLENTYVCDDEICHTKYETCFGPTLSDINDLSVKFRNDYDSQILTTQYNRILKTQPTIQIVSTKASCYEIDVYGTKGIFENVDNVMCFNGVCFDKFVWWNTSFPFRFNITFLNSIATNQIFSVNDTNLVNGDAIWTKKVNEDMFTYCIVENCTSGPIAIGNETDQLCWENETTMLGNCQTDVYVNNQLLVWHFGNDANDSTSNRLNGTVIDATLNASGLYTNAFRFDGSSTLITRATPLTEDQDYTVMAWIWLEEDDEDQTIASTVTTNNEQEEFVLKINQARTLTAFKRTDNTTTDVDDVTGTTALNIGQWYLVTFVYNQSKGQAGGNYNQGAMSIYVNATLEDDTAIDSNFGGFIAANVLQVGGLSHNLITWNLTGLIDDFRIYNRSALTQSEIENIYFNGPPNNLSAQGQLESFFGNTSIVHADFNIAPVVFDSSDYIPIGNFTYNISTANNLTFKGSMNIRKETNPQSSELSLRITCNGDVKVDAPIRTVEGTTDVGIASIPFFECDSISGINNLTVEAKESGIGSVNISNFKLHADSEISAANNTIDHDITENNFTYSSPTFASRGFFDINGSIASSEIIDVNQLVSATGSVTPVCFIQGNETTAQSLTYGRFLSGAADVGSTGINYLDSRITINSRWDFICSDAGETITNNATTYWFSTADSSNFTVQSSQFQNTSNATITAGTTDIINSGGFTLISGDEVDALITVIFQSLSGSQTPVIKINMSNGTTEEILEMERSFAGSDQIGTAKIYHDLENLTVGQTVTSIVSIIVPAGETINILNASLILYETMTLNTTETNLPPIPNIITNPANNTIVFGESENVSWLTFTDPNGNVVTYNISLFNKTGSFNATINNATTLLSTTINYSNFEPGDYDIVVEACDPFNACSNTTNNNTIIATPTCNVTFNVLDSSNSTNLNNVSVDCTSYTDSGLTSPFSNVFNFGFENCDINRTNYIGVATSFNCSGTDLEVNVSLSLIIPSTPLNITLVFDIGDLTLTNFFCQDNVTLLREYITEVSTSAGADNVTKSETITCEWGCDFFNKKCRENPIFEMLWFIVFIIFMAGLLLIPLFIITRRSKKKKLMLIIHITMIFLTLIIYIASIALLLPSVLTFFGEDFATLVIVFTSVMVVFFFILIILFINNIMKRRYA